MSDEWPGPPEGSVWLDEDHAYHFLSGADSPPPVGLFEYHRQPGGEEWCAGAVRFRGTGGASEWDVVSWDPLTLSPSLLCTECDMHGWIREGRWESA